MQNTIQYDNYNIYICSNILLLCSSSTSTTWLVWLTNKDSVVLKKVLRILMYSIIYKQIFFLIW